MQRTQVKEVSPSPSIAQKTHDSVLGIRQHYESLLRDMTSELHSKDAEIARLKETFMKRGKWEDEGLIPEGSTGTVTREDFNPKTYSENEYEKLRAQLTETMEVLANYRDKYYRAVQQIAVLEEKLTQHQETRKSPRCSPTLDHLRRGKKERRVVRSTNSSGIAYLIPEETTNSSPVAFAPSPVSRKGSKPKLRNDSRSYMPSHLRIKRPGSGPLREEQTEPYPQSMDRVRPDSRFADEFPEENELE